MRKKRMQWSSLCRYINEVLLTAGEKLDNLTYHFEHKMTSIDMDKGAMTFQKAGEKKEVEVKADMVFGCDGAFSTVRKAMMRKPWFNYRSVLFAYFKTVGQRIAPTNNATYLGRHFKVR